MNDKQLFVLQVQVTPTLRTELAVGSHVIQTDGCIVNVHVINTGRPNLITDRMKESLLRRTAKSPLPTLMYIYGNCIPCISLA